MFSLNQVALDKAIYDKYIQEIKDLDEKITLIKNNDTLTAEQKKFNHI